jgi:YidC/Oxa1 family membrane protein insertase
MVNLFYTFIYEPFYNALVALITVVPYADVGIAVVLLTILVKILLFPLARRASIMQAKVKELAPEMEEIKEKHKEDKQAQTLAMLALYKRENIRPFLSMAVVFIQLPVIFGLYWVFFKGGLPEINVDVLYSFIPVPEMVNMSFLGLIDMGGKSIVLALIAGVSQFIYSKFVLPEPPKRSDKPSLKDDLAHSFHLQMKYVMPVIVTVIAYTISAAVALYWATSNIFMILQEYFVKKTNSSNVRKLDDNVSLSN